MFFSRAFYEFLHRLILVNLVEFSPSVFLPDMFEIHPTENILNEFNDVFDDNSGRRYNKIVLERIIY